jgi:hypothetical protein
MLTWGEAVEVHALRERGWSIAAIARHLDRNPKTIRAYVNGEREPGRRRRRAPDPLAPYVGYLAARFVDDPHIWASALYDEVSRLGYRLSYVSFARQLRTQGLRPHCQACSGVRGQPTIQIDHPPGAELQWDWFERRRAPWGGTAYVLLGSLPHSGRVRGVLAEATDQPIWSRRSTACCAASAARRGSGAPIGWPRSWCPGPGTCSQALLRWPSTTASRSSRARRGGPTARARWSRRCGLCAAAGGGP